MAYLCLCFCFVFGLLLGLWALVVAVLWLGFGFVLVAVVLGCGLTFCLWFAPCVFGLAVACFVVAAQVSVFFVFCFFGGFGYLVFSW